MANYIPKAEQFDTLNSKLDAINENLKTRASFVEAVAKMENATEAAEEAATAANTAAAGVVSPTATVTKTGDTATITITDKSGTTTAEVKDGSDATVTKDAVVSALGYEPEKPGGEYELIETIELTEDTSEIIRTQEPDGTAYKFKAFIIMATGKTTNNNAFAYWNGNNGEAVALGRFSNAYNYKTLLRGFMMGGFIFAIGSDEAGYNVRTSQCIAAAISKSVYPNGYIDYVNFSTNSPMTVGTTIDLYGIRAN